MGDLFPGECMNSSPSSSREIRIPKVTAKTIMHVIEGLALSKSKGLSLEEICKYVDMSDVYVQRALESIIQLGMGTSTNGQYFCGSDCIVVTKANETQWPIIFRNFLQRFDPFILFIMLVGKGNSPENAARKTSIIYSIRDKFEIVRGTLLGWGAYAEIFEIDKKGKPKLKIETEKLEAEYLKELIEALESDIKARIYIAGKLTDEVFGYLNHDEIEFIISAIRKHGDDPRSAIEHVGRSFEDFLRRLGVDKDQEERMSQCKGIGQIADSLKALKLIHEKHYRLCYFINAMRLAAAHSKEAATMISWTIRPESAVETILITLTGIRSIYFYSFKNQNII